MTQQAFRIILGMLIASACAQFALAKAQRRQLAQASRSGAQDCQCSIRKGSKNDGNCACVICTFTVDNVVDSVKYNGVPLAISGGAVTDWKKEKVISFQSCCDKCPGVLEIKGTNSEYKNHCYWAGLLLRCTASRSSSPWHNFISDTTHWEMENGATPCQNDELFPVSGAGIPFIAAMNSFGAKKIWNNEKIATLRGSPAF